MSATVLHMAKTAQRRYPDDYNIRTQLCRVEVRKLYPPIIFVTLC